MFCREPHRDGTGARRVAVLQKAPRRLVTDDENGPWPDVPRLRVVASCRACWLVLCDQCREAGELTGYCEHNQRGEWLVEVRKIKAQLARSNRTSTSGTCCGCLRQEQPPRPYRLRLDIPSSKADDRRAVGPLTAAYGQRPVMRVAQECVEGAFARRQRGQEVQGEWLGPAGTAGAGCPPGSGRGEAPGVHRADGGLRAAAVA